MKLPAGLDAMACLTWMIGLAGGRVSAWRAHPVTALDLFDRIPFHSSPYWFNPDPAAPLYFGAPVVLDDRISEGVLDAIVQ